MMAADDQTPGSLHLRTTAELAHGGGATGFAHFANLTARAAGKPSTFVLCCFIILTWAVTGPVLAAVRVQVPSWPQVIAAGQVRAADRSAWMAAG